MTDRTLVKDTMTKTKAEKKASGSASRSASAKKRPGDDDQVCTPLYSYSAEDRP